MDASDRLERSRRVVITGMGAITPLGLDVPSTWQGLVEGRSGVGPITSFDASGYPTRIAAEIKAFEAEAYLGRREARRTSRFIQFATAAADEALADAALALDQEEPTRVGVEIGSALGGAQFVEEQRLLLEEKGPRAINPTLLPAVLINMAACYLAIRYGVHGPANAPVTACATGISALGEAMRCIVWGDAEVMIAGGTDSVVTPLGLAAFSRLGALSTRNETPRRAITPFDADRDGTVLGEGAAVMILEAEDHARARGAKILAEIVGYAATADAFHVAAPDPSGLGAARAIANALKSARLAPEEIDYIAAHGTGTIQNDASETRAVKTVFGEMAYRVPISSIKSMTGHTLGAAGALSAVAVVKAMGSGLIPPTIAYDKRDPDCDLDYVPNAARPHGVSLGLVNGFGIGGQNACLVLRRWIEE
jgi:3-oxoacyl-[acyl-carrier-protein] synthase II